MQTHDTRPHVTQTCCVRPLHVTQTRCVRPLPTCDRTPSLCALVGLAESRVKPMLCGYKIERAGVNVSAALYHPQASWRWEWRPDCSEEAMFSGARRACRGGRGKGERQRAGGHVCAGPRQTWRWAPHSAGGGTLLAVGAWSWMTCPPAGPEPCPAQGLRGKGMKTQHGGLTGSDSEGGEERARGRALAAPTSRGHTKRQKTDLKLRHARIPIQSPTQQPVSCR